MACDPMHSHNSRLYLFIYFQLRTAAFQGLLCDLG